MFYQDPEKFKNENGYDIDGVWYPRVNSILSIKAKPALYKFYADQPALVKTLGGLALTVAMAKIAQSQTRR